MTKRIRRLITVMLLMGFCISATAGYAKSFGPYASTLIDSYSVTCRAGSSGKITATAIISTNSKVDKLGFPVIRIQEKNGTSWNNITSTSSKYATNTGDHTYSISYVGTKGKTYRAYASFYAAKGSTTESRRKTSSTVTAK